jgi:peptidoglycan/xylan/chitin deacetylase (PgdA/CDA1 family)
MRRTLLLVALGLGVLSCANSTSAPPANSGQPPSSQQTSQTAPPSTPADSTSVTTSPPPTARTTPTKPPTTTTPPTLQRWYGREWNQLPTRRRIVALTFDAGGNAAGVPSILATLRREHIPATFFLAGNWVQHFPAEARTIAATARVADHSQTHPHFTQLTSTQIRAEVLGSAQVIEQTCGADPAPFFRFPYGDRNQRTIDAVNRVGYLPIGWTVDTLGWKGTRAGITVATIVTRVMAAAEPGEIVLMHVGANPDDGSTLDAAALPDVIAHLRAHGYSFVSVDELLTMAP